MNAISIIVILSIIIAPCQLGTPFAFYGVATWYGNDDDGFVGQVLACDTRHNDLYFDESFGAFVAVDPSFMHGHGWACGDKVQIEFVDHDKSLTAVVLDTGPLSRYYVADFGKDTPIVVDVASHAWRDTFGDFDLRSARVKIVNLSLVERVFNGGKR